MRKSVYIKWYEKMLKEVLLDGGVVSRQHPCINFSKRVKSGEFDELPDNEYDVLLTEVEEIVSCWNSKQYMETWEVCKNAIRKIRPNDETFHKLAEILAERYEKIIGPFVPENVILDSEEKYNLQLEFSDDFIEEENIYRKDLNPKQIQEYLTKYIHGQKEAVKAATMLLYNHMNGRKRNILFAGPDGCGKTEIWRTLKHLYPNIKIVDSAVLTQQGCSGNFKIKDIFADMKQEELEKSIIVFDEFDKLCKRKFSSQENNILADGQRKLLEMIEENISVVFCGNFDRLIEIKTEREIGPEDLVKYGGIHPEIAGYINQSVQLYPMTAEDYDSILYDDKMSPLHQLERQYGVILHLEKKTRQKLIKEAEDSYAGMRYLRSQIQRLLDEQMFEDCERTEYQLSLN